MSDDKTPLLIGLFPMAHIAVLDGRAPFPPYVTCVRPPAPKRKNPRRAAQAAQRKARKISRKGSKR